MIAIDFEGPGPDEFVAWLRYHREPAWMRDALCREVSACFFPGRGEPIDCARAVCARCLVRRECAQHALDDETLLGVWAGTTTGQRERARRDRIGVDELLALLTTGRVGRVPAR